MQKQHTTFSDYMEHSSLTDEEKREIQNSVELMKLKKPRIKKTMRSIQE